MTLHQLLFQRTRYKLGEYPFGSISEVEEGKCALEEIKDSA
jgi:hypothetical protein